MRPLLQQTLNPAERLRLGGAWRGNLHSLPKCLCGGVACARLGWLLSAIVVANLPLQSAPISPNKNWKGQRNFCRLAFFALQECALLTENEMKKMQQ